MKNTKGIIININLYFIIFLLKIIEKSLTENEMFDRNIIKLIIPGNKTEVIINGIILDKGSPSANPNTEKTNIEKNPIHNNKKNNGINKIFAKAKNNKTSLSNDVAIFFIKPFVSFIISKPENPLSVIYKNP